MSVSRMLLVMATVSGVVSALSTPPVVLASFPHARAATSDSRIKAQVNAALDADTRLRGRGVFVQSVHDGVVVLGGRARTMSDHLRATGDAAHVPGVHRVANEVEIQDLLADEKSRGGRTPPETERDYGTAAVHETRTRSATEARVRADSPTPGLGLVNVDTHSGAVTLFGTAPSARVDAAAEEDARKMRGRVAARSEHEAVKARDQELERAVREALKDRVGLADASIDVDVKRGVVRLTGTVPTQAQRRTAARSAQSVAGVKSVREVLRVSGR